MKSGIERIKINNLKELAGQYDILRGMEIMGEEVYVLLNPSIIKDFKEITSKDEE